MGHLYLLASLRGRHTNSSTPFVEAYPAVLPETQPAVDRISHERGPKDAEPIAHLPSVKQRRQGEGCAYAPPPGLFDGGDEVDPGHTHAHKQRRGRNRLRVKTSEVVAPRPVVAQTQVAVHLT